MCHTLNREVKIDDHMKVMLCSGPPPPTHPFLFSPCHDDDEEEAGRGGE